MHRLLPGLFQDGAVRASFLLVIQVNLQLLDAMVTLGSADGDVSVHGCGSTAAHATSSSVLVGGGCWRAIELLAADFLAEGLGKGSRLALIEEVEGGGGGCRGGGLFFAEGARG